MDLFYMDWLYWLKPELIEGLSMVGIVEFRTTLFW